MTGPFWTVVTPDNKMHCPGAQNRGSDLGPNVRRTRKEAMREACKRYGHHPDNWADLRRLGYRAEKIGVVPWAKVSERSS